MSIKVQKIRKINWLGNLMSFTHAVFNLCALIVIRKFDISIGQYPRTSTHTYTYRQSYDPLPHLHTATIALAIIEEIVVQPPPNPPRRI